jgi:tetratricopeptide (TPR) repeat protein
MPATTIDNLLVVIYMILRFFIPHLVAFTVAFLLLTANNKKSEASTITGNTTNLLFCVILGVVIHNLVDFAIFEPGVFTVFWTIIACIVAISFQNNRRPEFTYIPQRCVKIPIALAGVIIVSVYFNNALIPVAKTTAKIQLANRAISTGQLEYAHQILDSATDDDPLSSAAPFLNGKLYLNHFKLTSRVDHDLLLQAEKHLQTAIRRNSDAFKNYERLTEVYTQLADISKKQEKIDWLNKAFENASYSVEYLYPGCARLRIELAKIAEQLGKIDIAVKEYKKAIEIEDSYRVQFQEMYPERKEIVSRVDEDKYMFAKQRLKLYTGQLNQ